jgi:hypothetical protein
MGRRTRQLSSPPPVQRLMWAMPISPHRIRKRPSLTTGGETAEAEAREAAGPNYQTWQGSCDSSQNYMAAATNGSRGGSRGGKQCAFNVTMEVAIHSFVGSCPPACRQPDIVIAPSITICWLTKSCCTSCRGGK